MNSGEEFRAWSTALRRGMVEYDFKPTEVLLLLMLCDATFDRNALSAAVDLESWAAALRHRPDKLRPVWLELIAAGVVDYNAGQGTFQLRPDINLWSRLRGLRVPQNLRTGPELALTVERPLDEALSSMSREAVSDRAVAVGLQSDNSRPGSHQDIPPGAGGKDWGAEFRRLNEAISRGTVAEDFPEMSAGDFSPGAMAEKSPGAMAEKSATEKNQWNGGFAHSEWSPGEKSAAPIASLATVQKAKLAIRAEKSAAAWRWLEEIDKHKHLVKRISADQWGKLCQREPDFVLDRLRPRLLYTERKYREEKKEAIADPLAFLARICRDDRKFR